MRSIEDPVKVVEGTYKVLLEAVTPGLRQCLTSGKFYVKSLQNATIACKGYIDAIAHMAAVAEGSPAREVADIGAALKQLVQIQIELTGQQERIVKSLEDEFLGPLEVNIEKDSKQLVRDQKQFFQDYKKFSDTHSKAVATLTKNKKKNRAHGDVYLRNKEDAERRLNDFCEYSMAEVEAQERMRFEFLLRKQCLFANHCLDLHRMGQDMIEHSLGKWKETLERSREAREPPSPEPPGGEREPSDSEPYDGPLDNQLIDKIGSSSSLRSSDHEGPLYAKPLPRSKSDYNLPPITSEDNERLSRMTECNGTRDSTHVRVLYPFAASGEHQMSLQVGDVLTVFTKKKDGGWIFGENHNTKKSGWFPISYTEPLHLPEETQAPSGFAPSIQSLQRGRDSLRPHNTDRGSVASLRSRQSLSQSYDSLSGDIGNKRRPYPANPPRIPSPSSSGPSTPEMQRSRDSRLHPGNRYRGDGEPSRYPH